MSVKGKGEKGKKEEREMSTELQIQFETAFKTLDRDDDGTISAQELFVVLDSVGMKLNEEEIQVLLKESNAETGAENIDKQVFIEMMQQRLNDLVIKEEITEAFKVYDTK